MKGFNYILAGLIVCAGVAHAQAEVIGDVSCKVLAAETEQFFNEPESDDLTIYVVESPMMQFLDASMEGLDDEAILQIRRLLADNFWSTCIRPSKHTLKLQKERGLPENPTLVQVFDDLLDFHQLDRGSPRWGLTDLPVLDFRKQSWKGFFNAVGSFREGWLQNPQGDPIGTAIDRFWQDYDLRRIEDAKKASHLMTRISHEIGRREDPNEPIGVALDQWAAEEGLKRK